MYGRRVRLPHALPGMLNIRKYVCRPTSIRICRRSIRIGREPLRCAGSSTRTCTALTQRDFYHPVKLILSPTVLNVEKVVA